MGHKRSRLQDSRKVTLDSFFQ